jgi:hypothetical protein
MIAFHDSSESSCLTLTLIVQLVNGRVPHEPGKKKLRILLQCQMAFALPVMAACQWPQ